MAGAWDEILTACRVGGVRCPIVRRQVRGGWDRARVRTPHTPGGVSASTGRKPLVFDLQLVFYDGLVFEDDPADSIYPGAYQDLLDVLTTEPQFEYVDPLLGTFTVSVDDWTVDETATERHGASIHVMLEEENENAETFIVPPRSPGREVIEAAAAMDSTMDEAGVEDATVEDAMNESGYPLNSNDDAGALTTGSRILGVVTDLQDGLNQGLQTAREVQGRIDAVRYRVAAVQQTVEALGREDGVLALLDGFRVVSGATDLAERATRGQVPVLGRALTGTRTAFEIAVELYGDASRAAEVLSNNPIPGAVYPAGYVLRVLQS